MLAAMFICGLRQYVGGVKQMQYIAVDKIANEPLKQRTIKIAQDRANIIGMLKMGGEQKQLEAI